MATHPLAALMASMNDDGDDGDKKLSEFQQITRLRKIAETMDPNPALKPGMIVCHRFPGEANSNVAKQPGLFLRWLDKPVQAANHPEAFEDVTDWASHMTASRFDCAIGFMRGETYAEFLGWSGHWREATGDDYGHETQPTAGT